MGKMPSQELPSKEALFAAIRASVSDTNTNNPQASTTQTNLFGGGNCDAEGDHRPQYRPSSSINGYQPFPLEEGEILSDSVDRLISHGREVAQSHGGMDTDSYPTSHGSAAHGTAPYGTVPHGSTAYDPTDSGLTAYGSAAHDYPPYSHAARGLTAHNPVNAPGPIKLSPIKPANAYSDIPEWLELTGFHNEEFRSEFLKGFRKTKKVSTVDLPLRLAKASVSRSSNDYAGVKKSGTQEHRVAVPGFSKGTNTQPDPRWLDQHVRSGDMARREREQRHRDSSLRAREMRPSPNAVKSEKQKKIEHHWQQNLPIHFAQPKANKSAVGGQIIRPSFSSYPAYGGNVAQQHTETGLSQSIARSLLAITSFHTHVSPYKKNYFIVSVSQHADVEDVLRNGIWAWHQNGNMLKSSIAPESKIEYIVLYFVQSNSNTIEGLAVADCGQTHQSLVNKNHGRMTVQWMSQKKLPMTMFPTLLEMRNSSRAGSTANEDFSVELDHRQGVQVEATYYQEIRAAHGKSACWTHANIKGKKEPASQATAHKQKTQHK